MTGSDSLTSSQGRLVAWDSVSISGPWWDRATLIHKLGFGAFSESKEPKPCFLPMEAGVLRLEREPGGEEAVKWDSKRMLEKSKELLRGRWWRFMPGERLLS